jgi:hydrogenase maturation protein HypF
MQFHNTLAHIVCTIAMKHTMQDDLLTGGVMQNKVLSILCIEGLQKAGFIPYWHGSIPAGDGGIAAGQALYPLFIKAGS